MAAAPTVDRTARRAQDRLVEQRRFDPEAPFANEPDTDFTRAANRQWIADHLRDDRPAPLPPLVTTTAGIDELVARARDRCGALGGDVDRTSAARPSPGSPR